MSQESFPIRGYDETWPPIRGDYVVGSPESRVAVVTLASHLRAAGAALIGPCKTENLGVEKVVANTISNSNIRFLILCGVESKGHLPGDALLALHKNGIDEQGRILGSHGAIPFIQNLPPEAIRRFQDQIELIDRIGLEDVGQIELLIREYGSKAGQYPEEPFQVVKRRIRPGNVSFGIGDLSLGSGVVMDTSAWLVVDQLTVSQEV
jgi:tetrahydromethanopterin S-methyltransferase subunit A